MLVGAKTKKNPKKAGVLWCNLNNLAVNSEFIEKKELMREQYLQYLGITFDRILWDKEHISSVLEGNVAVKNITMARMSKKIFVILFK